MYRKHQAEKKSRIFLNRQMTKPNASDERPSSTQNQQLDDRIEDTLHNIKQIGHQAGQDQERGGSKTTAADRAILEKEHRDIRNFYAVDVETNGFTHNEPI